jgi:hypothetical protein
LAAGKAMPAFAYTGAIASGASSMNTDMPPNLLEGGF